MATVRSPRYPAIGLGDAIDKARAVYQKDFRNKISKELVAQHMGYGGLNGASLGVVSAVAKYGLLDGNRDAMWVTGRAMDIFERERGDPERVSALRAAAAEPDMFREIDHEFPGKASDAAIRTFLVTKLGVLPESAIKVIKAYRETQEILAAELGEDSNVGASPIAVNPPIQDGESPSLSVAQTRAAIPAVGPMSAADLDHLPGPGMSRAAFPLAEGPVYLTFPEGLTADGYEELAEYLQIFLKRAQRQKRADAAKSINLDDLL